MVESDIILSEIADNIGFDIKRIVAVTERQALENRTRKVGTLRESVIILQA